MANLGLMAENEDMMTRLKKIDTIHEVVIEIRTNQKNHDGVIKRHEATLYGNGQTGLCEKMGIVTRLVYIIGGGSVLIAVAIIGMAIKR